MNGLNPAPTASALRKELDALQSEVVGLQGACTLLRVPHITAAPHEQATAQFFSEALLHALRGSVPIEGTLVMLPQFTATLLYQGGTLYDALDFEVCAADQLVERFTRRRLWHPDCPFPVDLGLCDDQPSDQDIIDHQAAIWALIEVPGNPKQ